MPNRENVIKGLKKLANDIVDGYIVEPNDAVHCVNDTLALLKEQEKEVKALRLLVEWAEECDFGFDQFPDEYERYKDEIKDMKYIDGMIHIAKRTLEDNGAFEEGR